LFWFGLGGKMASFGNSVLKRSQGARDEGRLGELRRPRAGRQSIGLNETYLPVPISYDPQSRDLIVNAFRSSATYGQEFLLPELYSVSSAGSNLVEAMQRSLYHELGHSIFDAAGPETERQVRRLLRGGRAMPVSLLAREEAVEYFCETFVAYRFEDGLADKDPEGYDMVEAILRMVFRK
jgi:hypothetical protein